MADPKHIVGWLINDRKMTEQDVVDALRKLGVKTTQPTINRIKNGNQDPGWRIGRALEQLHQQHQAA